MPRKHHHTARTTWLPRAALLVSCATFTPLAAEDGEPWRTVAAVEHVTISVHWVSEGSLMKTARKLGKTPASRPEGFSVLRRDTASGRFACDIYLVDQPRRVGDRATDSLGHEMAHCLGLSHERSTIARQ